MSWLDVAIGIEVHEWFEKWCEGWNAEPAGPPTDPMIFNIVMTGFILFCAGVAIYAIWKKRRD